MATKTRTEKKAATTGGPKRKLPQPARVSKDKEPVVDVEIEELSADELHARAEALAQELLHVDWKTALARIDAGELAGTYAEFKLTRLRGLIER